MGMAFGISSDDVLAVALKRGVKMTDAQAEKWFDQLDADEVEEAALHGDDMDEQTEYAYQNIDEQLDALGCWTSD